MTAEDRMAGALGCALAIGVVVLLAVALICYLLYDVVEYAAGALQ